MTEPAAQTFHAAAADRGRTLAALLRARLPGRPWSQVQRLIRTRRVMVDGNLCCDEGRRLRGTEVVKVLPHAQAPPAREEDVRIRYLDEFVVVVEKPAGLTSVRHHEERNWNAERRNRQPTLEDMLPRIIAKLERSDADRRTPQGKPKRGKPERRPSRTPPVRPVHRLDRETSGLMVFARTVPAERNLGQQFRKHTTHRRYTAVVEGAIERRTIETQLVRDRGDGRRGSTDEADVGKRSVTHITPVEPLRGYTVVECRLETGRTHQIRIHLAEQGHPLCGDKVYRKPLFGEPIADRSGAPRLALHAAELGFEHPLTGVPMQFTMPLPRDLMQFLERLRKQSAPHER